MKLSPTPTIITPKCYTPARVYVKPLFPYQLGAAITVDKAQGRTLDKVVACLSKRDENVYEMDINSVFVALSRVRHRNDLRLLIHDRTNFESELGYIESLQHDKEYFDWMKGFEICGLNEPMSWNRKLALSEI